jgi:hypothetical protein
MKQTLIKQIHEKIKKIIFSFVVWVFVLSIPWGDEPLFETANRILVRGSWEFVERKTMALWEGLLRKASIKYTKLKKTTDEKAEEIQVPEETSTEDLPESQSF